MLANTSCTYRAWTTCGYPGVKVGTNNILEQGDFDIAWAGYNGIDLGDDIDGWNFNLTARFTGSKNTKDVSYNSVFAETIVNTGAERIGDAEWNACNSTARSLYIILTRTKVSFGLEAAEDFLAPRQLNKFYDYELTFMNLQGPVVPTGARFLAVISFAFAAVIAVFAF